MSSSDVRQDGIRSGNEKRERERPAQHRAKVWNGSLTLVVTGNAPSPQVDARS